MIYFDNWQLTYDGEIIAQQNDNLTRSVTITGDIPEGWAWELLVQVEDAMDIIPLTASVGTLSVVLTKEQVSIPGYYTVQLRATQGDLVRHTNLLERIYIPRSLSGDAHWPELPTAFSEMEARVKAEADRAQDAAGKAAGYSSHPPVIGDNGNWQTWDGAEYADTGLEARGPQGETGPTGPSYTLTDTDKSDMVQAVLDALPAAEGVSF